MRAEYDFSGAIKILMPDRKKQLSPSQPPLASRPPLCYLTGMRNLSARQAAYVQKTH